VPGKLRNRNYPWQKRLNGWSGLLLINPLRTSYLKTRWRDPALLNSSRSRPRSSATRCLRLVSSSVFNLLFFPFEQKIQPPPQVVNRSIEIAHSFCVRGYFHSLKVQAQIIRKLSGTLDTLCR